MWLMNFLLVLWSIAEKIVCLAGLEHADGDQIYMFFFHAQTKF